MKLVKMSLVAAMVMGASAFAIDNVKVSGDAKLYYSASDQGANVDLFDKDGAAADTALRVGMTGDLLKGVSFGVTGYAVSSLGLENNLVSGVWSGAHTATANGSSLGAQVNDEMWIGEAWMATTMGKTTAKAGRMELDTPLAFSEKWNIASNTFEAAVLINQDIADTTLVGAWVGKGNGSRAAAAGIPASAGINSGVVNGGAAMNTFVSDGTYVAAIINNSFKPLVAQAWYYNVANVADAFWLQADWDCQLVKDVKLGVQYASMSPKNAGLTSTTTDDSSAYAVQLAYAGIQNVKLSAAYSSADKADGGKTRLNIANVATGFGQSKLYTEAAWVDSFGRVGAAGTDTWNVKASYDAKDLAKFCASYTNADNSAAANAGDMEEIALSVSKSFGPLDAKLAYVNTELDGGNNYNTVNAYLTLNF